MIGAIFPICGGVTRDFAFDEREFKATDSGGLSSAEYSSDGGLLILVHLNKVFAQVAAAHARQFDVGNEMKAASEIVTFDFAGLPLARNAHGFHATISEGGDWPTIGPVGNAAKIVGKAKGLGGFAGNQHHLEAEARHPRASGLLADANHFCSTFARVGGHGEKQRAGTGDDDAFSRYIEAGFYQGLQAASAHDVRKSPAWERQEKFARTGGEN